MAAERNCPTPEVRGPAREELAHLQGAAAARAEEGREELLHVQGQEGRREKMPLLQGKEQRPHFAGAALKRYPSSKVRETQVGRCCERASEGRHTKTMITGNQPI